MNATEAIFSHPIDRDNLAVTPGKHVSPFHFQAIQSRRTARWKIALVGLILIRSTSLLHA